MKNKIIVSSILTIALCLSMIAGSTFALFTSESKVNVAVTSGEVKVVATADAASLKVGSTLGTPIGGAEIKTVDGIQTIEITNFVPGDYVSFDINVENESSVAIKYRTVLSVTEEADTALFAALDVRFGKDAAKYDGKTQSSAWVNLAPTNHPEKVTVTVSFPDAENNNDFMGKTCTISYKVEAVQGNAVNSVEQLQDAINSGVDKITLSADIAPEDKIIIPEGKTVTIDLNGKTVNGGYQAGSTSKHIYAFENHGHLTLKNGTVNARGVSNYGTLVVESGTYNAIDTNGGGSIWAYTGSETIINGGEFYAADVTTSPAATTLNVASGAKATINGGKFYANANQTYGIINSGELIINDCEIYADHGVVSSAGTLVVNGGKFVQRGNLVQTSSLFYITSGTTTITGGTFNFNVEGKLDSGLPVYCAGGSVAISGGTFTGYVTEMISSWGGTGSASVTGGTFDKDPVYVADGYKAVENNGVWTVVAE